MNQHIHLSEYAQLFAKNNNTGEDAVIDTAAFFIGKGDYLQAENELEILKNSGSACYLKSLILQLTKNKKQAAVFLEEAAKLNQPEACTLTLSRPSSFQDWINIETITNSILNESIDIEHLSLLVDVFNHNTPPQKIPANKIKEALDAVGKNKKECEDVLAQIQNRKIELEAIWQKREAYALEKREAEALQKARNQASIAADNALKYVQNAEICTLNAKKAQDMACECASASNTAVEFANTAKNEATLASAAATNAKATANAAKQARDKALAAATSAEATKYADIADSEAKATANEAKKASSAQTNAEAAAKKAQEAVAKAKAEKEAKARAEASSLQKAKDEANKAASAAIDAAGAAAEYTKNANRYIGDIEVYRRTAAKFAKTIQEAKSAVDYAEKAKQEIYNASLASQHAEQHTQNAKVARDKALRAQKSSDAVSAATTAKNEASAATTCSNKAGTAAKNVKIYAEKSKHYAQQSLSISKQNAITKSKNFWRKFYFTSQYVHNILWVLVLSLLCIAVFKSGVTIINGIGFSIVALATICIYVSRLIISYRRSQYSYKFPSSCLANGISSIGDVLCVPLYAAPTLALFFQSFSPQSEIERMVFFISLVIVGCLFAIGAVHAHRNEFLGKYLIGLPFALTFILYLATDSDAFFLSLYVGIVGGYTFLLYKWEDNYGARMLWLINILGRPLAALACCYITCFIIGELQLSPIVTVTRTINTIINAIIQIPNAF